MVLFSPLGPLDHDELDLIAVPANSALIDVLLPNRTVAVGETWKLDTDWLAPVLGLDTVDQSNIVCKLDRVEKNLAIIHAQGVAAGSADGVSSQMTVAAKFSFDTQLKRITWYAMSLKENRAIGHAQPGLEATSRVQMALQKRSASPSLHQDVLADLNLKPDEPARLLEFRSPAGGFALLMDRRWHVMIEREDVSVLRMVDRGELIAQANISALPPLEAGETFTIVDFQQDVKRALADHFGEFVAASESVTDSGLRVMRVVTTGRTAELSIDWVYYHVTDDQGRRLSCVFTHESELAERFGAVDQSLLSSLRFVEKTAAGRGVSRTLPKRYPDRHHNSLPESDPTGRLSGSRGSPPGGIGWGKRRLAQPADWTGSDECLILGNLGNYTEGPVYLGVGQLGWSSSLKLRVRIFLWFGDWLHARWL